MIRKAIKRDLKQMEEVILRVVDEVNSRFYKPEVIRVWKEHIVESIPKDYKKGEFVVYEKEKKIVATGGLVENKIERVYVLPEYSGKGIGKQIMLTLEQIAKDKHISNLELTATVNAVKFYESLGYKKTGDIEMERDGVRVSIAHMEKKVI